MKLWHVLMKNCVCCAFGALCLEEKVYKFNPTTSIMSEF
jgi:hypothetical protein